MATKTVINSNATRGISILIDQPQQQVVDSQHHQQRHATAKINISPVATNSTTTATYAASTSSTTSSAYSSLGSDGQPTAAAAAAATMTVNNSQQHKHNNNNYSTTFIDINCPEDADRNSRTGSESKKSTTTFPQLLLRVAAAAAAAANSQDQVNIKEITTTTTTAQLSERRKTKANGELDEAAKPENSERVHVGQSVGISITHEHKNNNNNSKQLKLANNEIVTTLPTTTTIIECNSNRKDDHDEHGHNNDNHDVAAAVAHDAIVESRLRGDGVAPIVVIASAATTRTSSTSLSQRPEQLENFVATSSLELADCTSALTESVESNAVKDSHVVKIKISPNNSEKTSETPQSASEDKKVFKTVVEKLQSVKENIVGENKLVKISLVQLQNEPEKEAKKLETKIENFKLKIYDKMVQKPSSTATTVATSTMGTQGTTTSGNTTVTELNVSNPSNYLYYMMSSGQFSPCDTLDSGTGSDLESNGNNNNNSNNNKINSPTPKLSTIATNGAPKKLELHLKTTKIRMHAGGGGGGGDEKHHSTSNGEHQRAGSLTDSEESESSLSCDSLNSSDYLRHSTISLNGNGHSIPKPPPTPTSLTPPGSKSLGSFLPDSLLRDIRDRKFPTNDFISKYVDNNRDQTSLYDAIEESTSADTHNGVTAINYQVVESHVKFARGDKMTQRISLPNKTFILNAADGTFVDTKMNSMPRTYEADKYYEFHVNEHENFRSFGGGCDGSEMGDTCSEAGSWMDYEPRSQHEDAFAGYKDIRCSSAASTIRSSKGTVRGVKNRVRNGIATFLQLQQPNVKNFKEKDLGKVVLYTTSMGIIRDTYAKCSNVKQILRTLLVKFEERDVFMSVEYQQEIKERMHSEAIKVPQLFVEGQHIGDAETVERLNESGELRQLLKPYKSIATTYTCQTCGGYRLLPCPSCNGSKKSVHRNHFTAEFVALKCMNCDEVGLVKCHNC